MCAALTRKASAPVPGGGSTPIVRGFGKTPGRTGYERTNDPSLAPHLHQREPPQTIRDARREVEHIRGGKSRRGKCADKQFVDHAIALDADCGRRGGGGMSGNHQAHLWPDWGQRDRLAIVERTCHPAFRMGAHVIRCMRKCPASRPPGPTDGSHDARSNHSKASREHIEEWSSVAIQSVQTKQHGRRGKHKLGSIAGNHLGGPQQFASVIPIAWSTQRPQKVMRMSLEQDRASAHHFSPLAPLIAWGAHLIKTTMGGRQ